MKKFCGKEHELYALIKAKYLPPDYSTEGRRAGGAGVPVSVINPL